MTQNTNDQTDKHPWSHPLRVADLPTKRATTFELAPDAPGRKAIAAQLGLLELRKIRFSGTLQPLGKKSWRLEGMLGATVVQACVVTTDPVMTRLDEPTERSFVPEIEHPEEGAEFEMHHDDTIEELGEIIDIGEIMIEALALALPLYPRIEGADVPEAVFTEPGKAAMTDEDARPFAALKSLRDGLKGQDD